MDRMIKRRRKRTPWHKIKTVFWKNPEEEAEAEAQPMIAGVRSLGEDDGEARKEPDAIIQTLLIFGKVRIRGDC